MFVCEEVQTLTAGGNRYVTCGSYVPLVSTIQNKVLYNMYICIIQILYVYLQLFNLVQIQ